MALSHFFESIWQFEFDNFAPADFSPVEAEGNVVLCHGPLVRAFSPRGDVGWTLQESPNMGSSAVFERTETHLYFEYKGENRTSVLVEADHGGTIGRQFELNSKIQRFGSAQRANRLAFVSSSKAGGTLHVLTADDVEPHLLGFVPNAVVPAKDGWMVRSQHKGAVFVDDHGDSRMISHEPTWDSVASKDGPFGLLTGTSGDYRFALFDDDGAELRRFDAASPFSTQHGENAFLVARKADRAWLTAIDWRGEIAWETELGDVDNYRLWAASGWVGVTRVGGFQMFRSDDGSLVAESRLAWAAPLVLDGVCYWNGSSTVIATTMNPSD